MGYCKNGDSGRSGLYRLVAHRRAGYLRTCPAGARGVVERRMEHPLTAQARHAGAIYPGIVIDPEIMHGVPIIATTRIPARLIIGQLAGGESIEAIMQAYALTQRQVRAALGYAATLLEAETVYVLPEGTGPIWRSSR